MNTQLLCHSERGFSARNLLSLGSVTEAVCKQQIPPCRNAPRRNDKGSDLSKC
jgi:hypothetical protein